MALVLAGLALCLLAALPVQAARNTQKRCFPLDTTAWRISDAYGKRIDPFTGKAAFHQGLDLACAAGTAVRAVQGGVVTAAAYSPSYGNHLRILHPDGCETRYAHLQYLYVRPGEVVQAGQTLDAINVCIDSAIDSLLELTGERASDAVIDQVFARFCVGK